MAKGYNPKTADRVARIMSLIVYSFTVLITAVIYYSIIYYFHNFWFNFFLGAIALGLLTKLGMWFFKKETRPGIEFFEENFSIVIWFFWW